VPVTLSSTVVVEGEAAAGLAEIVFIVATANVVIDASNIVASIDLAIL